VPVEAPPAPTPAEQDEFAKWGPKPSVAEAKPSATPGTEAKPSATPVAEAKPSEPEAKS
jgi:hypothetical protein